MDRTPLSRRTLLSLAAGAGAATVLGACGSSGPGTAKGGGASYWSLTGQPQQAIREHTVERFNKANPDTPIAHQQFENDAFKTKIKTAIGAGTAPTLIWGWGGGGLKSYVEGNQVEDLTSWFAENPTVKDRLFPTSFPAATVNDKIYAMPVETVQPLVLYYNKKLFEQAGARPPQSWDDMMALVPVFNGKNIAPFTLAGASRWTNMMWLEFLYDRIGGPEVFQAIFDGQPDAWSHPASKDALTRTQQLIKANGFIKGFSSITAEGNADLAPLYTGRAAMMLHGSWTYGSIAEDGGDFVSGGSLGFMNFPPVEGGKGDPTNTFGNPGQYLSISSKAGAEQKDAAKKFMAAQLDDTEVQEWIANGMIPIVKGSEAQLATAKHPDFLKFVYDTSINAKNFGQSWDQSLSPTASEILLDNIAKLFTLDVTPDQFIANMNGTIGK